MSISIMFRRLGLLSISICPCFVFAFSAPASELTSRVGVESTSLKAVPEAVCHCPIRQLPAGRDEILASSAEAKDSEEFGFAKEKVAFAEDQQQLAHEKRILAEEKAAFAKEKAAFAKEKAAFENRFVDADGVVDGSRSILAHNATARNGTVSSTGGNAKQELFAPTMGAGIISDSDSALLELGPISDAASYARGLMSSATSSVSSAVSGTLRKGLERLGIPDRIYSLVAWARRAVQGIIASVINLFTGDTFRKISSKITEFKKMLTNTRTSAASSSSSSAAFVEFQPLNIGFGNPLTYIYNKISEAFCKLIRYLKSWVFYLRDMLIILISYVVRVVVESMTGSILGHLGFPATHPAATLEGGKTLFLRTLHLQKGVQEQRDECETPAGGAAEDSAPKIEDGTEAALLDGGSVDQLIKDTEQLTPEQLVGETQLTPELVGETKNVDAS